LKEQLTKMERGALVCCGVVVVFYHCFRAAVSCSMIRLQLIGYLLWHKLDISQRVESSNVDTTMSRLTHVIREILESLFLNINQKQICFISSVDYLGTQ